MNSYLRSAADAIQEVTDGLSVEVLARPRNRQWSIAEILEHLTLAFTANAAAIEKVLASGELRGRPPVLAERLGRILVIDIGYFPRVQAPEMTQPSGTIAPERSVAAVQQALAKLDDTLARAAGRFGDSIRVANHPYFAGLTVRQWRKFHWRHTLHHMRQIRTGVRA